VQQNEKRRLESIVPIRLLIQKPLTHAAHHWPVAAHQAGKSRFILLVDKSCEEFLIARQCLWSLTLPALMGSRAGELPNMPHHPLQGRTAHDRFSKSGSTP
jgi:hypothetical protein